MSFQGFPERALIFYEGLEADNSKPYWTDHRDVYERDVRAPMLALLAEVEEEFGTGKLFRPYRDVRFAKDKTPYKVNAAASVEGLYVSLGGGRAVPRRRLLPPRPGPARAAAGGRSPTTWPGRRWSGCWPASGPPASRSAASG